MFTSIACLPFNTLDNINTPCSVNTYGAYLRPPLFEVAICDLKVSNLVFSKLKHEIFRKSVNVSVDLLYVSFCLYTV